MKIKGFVYASVMAGIWAASSTAIRANIPNGNFTDACPQKDKHCASGAATVTCKTVGLTLMDTDATGGTYTGSPFGESCSTYTFTAATGCRPLTGGCGDIRAIIVQKPSE